MRPGARSTADGTYANRADGTRYNSAADLASRGNTFRAGAYGYRYYTPNAYAGYAYAWNPSNLMYDSLYTNPGYAAVASQIGVSAPAAPQDYGGNVVVQGGTVYVNGDPAATTQQYAEQATQIAAAGQSAPPADDSAWMPLGIFAIVEGDAKSSDDTFQLAVNSQGVIRGNYHNLRDDQVESVSGTVDKTSQRAAWTIGSDQAPVYEAGIANLTKNETPVLVYTADGQPRQLALIRLEQPAEQTDGSAPPSR